ncbi:hypothetical protein [Hydrogenophaga sp.]|uniref:hypothetical protein n=1 Tax=Hydrogenophaga sp. TaxID=1904254 RepID=UPI002719873F|nr:hypothetical protein [Hydrogenophaga sp.]MDO9437533.1 hypothetical protein [Hydrogenophaga sp.]
MKPTVEDQLQGTCRILETVVAPCVVDPLARTILDGLIANLRMLTGALPAVAGFLRHDNQATVDLLAALRGSLHGDLAANLDQALTEPDPNAVDPTALDARNHQLRDLLAQAVCSEGLTSEQHRAIVQHMTERASRVPMRYVATAPSLAPVAKT